MQVFYLSKNAFQTKRIGRKFAKEVLKKEGLKKAFIIGLSGDLGGGKTTFLQGFAVGLGIKEKVLSPTFVIMRKHEIKNRSFLNKKQFCHFDCYRISKPKEILSIDFKKNISDPQNIIAIEWAERVKSFLPKDTIWIKFDFVDKNTRKIIFKNR